VKAKIGPYLNFIGAYQIADMIFFWQEKYPDDNSVFDRWDYKLHDRFATWLAGTWVQDFCEWIYKKRKRTVKIKIDYYDVWSADHTLALVIKPVLEQLKEVKHGYGWIDDVDVPEELRSTAPGARDGLEYEHDWDHNAEKRYDYVLDEMIWAFTQLTDDTSEDKFYDHSESEKEKDFMESIKKLKVDREGLKAHQERVTNGIRLFGRYYQTLWD